MQGDEAVAAIGIQQCSGIIARSIVGSGMPSVSITIADSGILLGDRHLRQYSEMERDKAIAAIGIQQSCGIISRGIVSNSMPSIGLTITDSGILLGDRHLRQHSEMEGDSAIAAVLRR